MNKQDNKLALSVLAMLTAAIALIYTLIMYHNIIFAVIGMSILFLITAFVLTQNLIAFSSMKNKSLNVQIKAGIDDISAQLEAMNGAQSQIGKATYLYTKQAAQTVATLENNYAESQDALYKNLASLSGAQNKATRLMIKYNQDNTVKVIANIKDMCNKLTDTMIHGFDQIQPDSAELVALLEEITNYLKTRTNGMEQTLSLQLNNVAHELQNISDSIQQVQIPVQNITPVSPASDTAVPLAEPLNKTASESVSESIPSEMTITEDSPVENIANPTVAAINTTTDSAIEETAAENPDGILSPDDPSFTPTFTIVGKSDTDETAAEDIAKSETVESVTTINDLNSNPNKTLSADEIAALFAAADPAPKKESHPASKDNSTTETTDEPADITPVSDNPNKQLSPDEIAALFASLG